MNNFKLILVIDGWGISCEIALRWMSLDLTDDKLTLVHVMAWCRQAKGICLSQWWPSSMTLRGDTRIQWVKPGLYSMRAYARVYARIRAHTQTVGAAVYTSVAGCAQRIRAYTRAYAVKVQTCWTFKASADQRRHSSQSRKRSKVTRGRRVVLHRDVCGRIPTHTLACLYFYPRRNLRYAVATHRQPQAWTSAPAAGAYARIEYKPGFNVVFGG